MKQVLFFGLALQSIAWLLPNHYLPWPSAYQDFASFATGLVFLTALFFNISVKKQSLCLPQSCLFFIALSSIHFFQLTADKIYFAGDALISSLYILGFATMLCVGYNISTNRQERLFFIKWLAGALIFSASLSAAIALYQWTLQPASIWIVNLPPNSRPFANLAQPNQLATLLAMGLAATLYFYEKYALHRISTSLLATLLLFGLALTQSRAGWLMAVFFAVVWIWKFRYAPRRLSRRWALVWVAVFIGFIFTIPQLSQWLMLGNGVSVAERAQATGRWQLYTQFYQAILQSPFWGYGWQQVSTAQLTIAPLFDKLLYTEYTHNILLDLLIWNGPLLGSIIIISVSTYLLRLAFLAKNTESIFLVLAIGCFLVHSLLEYPHAYAYFLLPIGLMIGCLQAQFTCKTWSLPRWPIAIFLVGSTALYATIWYEYRIIEEDYRLMRFEKNRVGTLKAEQLAPDVIFLTQLQALTKYSRFTVSSNMPSSEIEELYRFSRRFTHPEALFKYAQALALNNQPEEAYQQLELIRKLHGQTTVNNAVEVLKQQTSAYPEFQLLIEKTESSNLIL